MNAVLILKKKYFFFAWVNRFNETPVLASADIKKA